MGLVTRNDRGGGVDRMINKRIVNRAVREVVDIYASRYYCIPQQIQLKLSFKINFDWFPMHMFQAQQMNQDIDHMGD